MAEQAMSAGPLEGVRVLDLATMLAGPYGATLLGDLGADVIKVESHYGDDSRNLGPEVGMERTPFLSLNRNKRAVVLDLMQDSAKEVFGCLLATTDILITNVRGPALEELGISYEQACRHRPDIIWIGVTAFGADGPYAGRPGIDFLAQGYAGLLAMNGHPGEPPVRVLVPLVDVMTSMLVSNAALAALRVRDRTGKGQRIDISLLDATVHAQASNIGSVLNAGENPPKTGNRSQYFSPSGIFTCGDGKGIVITCPSDKFFRHLCTALELDLADDPRFEHVEQRLENQEELERRINERCKAYDRDALVDHLIQADVLTAPIKEMPEVVEDPQILHNRMIVEVPHDTLGSVKVTGVPIHFHETPGRVRMAPPPQGHHTQELLVELGYAADAIERLRASRAIATYEDVKSAKQERARRRAAKHKR